MRRRLVAAVALAVLCGCTPEQVLWWQYASDDEKAAVVDHLSVEAASEFGVDPDLLIAIRNCEGGTNPLAANPRSSARGLWQHLLRYWPGRAAAVGMPDAPWWDPVAQARVSAWMLAEQGTTPWAPSRYCWR